MGSCIGQGNILSCTSTRSGTQTAVVEKAIHLRKCCHSSILFPPSTSAPKPQTRQGSSVLAMYGSERFLVLSFEKVPGNSFFKEVNVCGFPWILAVSGTIKYQFFPLVLENHSFLFFKLWQMVT